MSRPTIMPGQVWRSRDKRDNGRTVTVLSVEPGVNAFVTVESVRKSRMRDWTLWTRYELVRDAPGGSLE